MKTAMIGSIKDKKAGVMGERGYDSGNRNYSIGWVASRVGEPSGGHDNRPLPWDKEVRQLPQENVFAKEVWKVCDEIGNLLISKQADYGPGNINNAHGGAINGLLVRIGDKFERLKNLFSSKKKPNHESIQDSFKDLANYAIIALMVERGVWPKS